MTSGVADDVAEADIHFRTTELPCLVCLTTMSLDDDQPKLGTIRWQISPYFGLKRGVAVGFRTDAGGLVIEVTLLAAEEQPPVPHAESAAA